MVPAALVLPSSKRNCEARHKPCLNTELRDLSNASLQNIRFIIRLSAHLFPRSSRVLP